MKNKKKIDALYDRFKNLFEVKQKRTKKGKIMGRPPADLEKIVKGLYMKISRGLTFRDLEEFYDIPKSVFQRAFEKYQKEGIFKEIENEILEESKKKKM